MKKMLFAGALVALLMGGFTPSANAHCYNRNEDDMWLRYVAYPVHAAGIVVEYSVLRPIHWFVSQPNMDILFGHKRSEDCSCRYMKWEQQ